MLQRSLDKGDMKRFVAAMLNEGKVRGPVAGLQGAALCDSSIDSDLALDYANFLLPPKREFFPQCEVIGSYDAAGTREEPINEENVVIFGVRPCDAQAISNLDKVFGDKPCGDPYYQKKRDAALVISLACAKPAPGCFCSSVGGAPAGKTGADIIAFNLGKTLLLEAVSERGEAFLDKNAGLFREPAPAEAAMRNQQESDALKLLPAVAASAMPGALQKKNDPLFWEAIAETCLSCGACTFLCPTCHCFDLHDESQGAGGKRLRIHDACMFTAFAREASGHNPRSKPSERMRQRILHKFSYAPENYNEIFCVGCGRCIANCPSNIDIRETIAKATL